MSAKWIQNPKCRWHFAWISSVSTLYTNFAFVLIAKCIRICGNVNGMLLWNLLSFEQCANKDIHYGNSKSNHELNGAKMFVIQTRICAIVRLCVHGACFDWMETRFFTCFTRILLLCERKSGRNGEIGEVRWKKKSKCEVSTFVNVPAIKIPTQCLE